MIGCRSESVSISAFDLAGESRGIHQRGAFHASPQFAAQRCETNKVAAEFDGDAHELVVGFSGEFQQIELK
jgi:hypothetical protein